MLGFKGPRKMTVLLPGMTADGNRTEFHPINVRTYSHNCLGLLNNLDLAFISIVYINGWRRVLRQDNDGMIKRWEKHNMEGLLELHNKSPIWNEGT